MHPVPKCWPVYESLHVVPAARPSADRFAGDPFRKSNSSSWNCDGLRFRSSARFCGAIAFCSTSARSPRMSQRNTYNIQIQAKFRVQVSRLASREGSVALLKHRVLDGAC